MRPTKPIGQVEEYIYDLEVKNKRLRAALEKIVEAPDYSATQEMDGIKAIAREALGDDG